jgi:hypothetical protein
MMPAISMSFLCLQRDEKWKEEKPYHVLFHPPEGLEKSNLNLQQVNGITVNNIRELDSPPTIEKNGFMLIKIDTGPLISEDFDDHEKMAKWFLPQASRAVKEALGAQRIQFFDTTVCQQNFFSLLFTHHLRRFDDDILNSLFT